MNNEKLKVHSVRLSDSQYRKFLMLGGNSWLRITLMATKKSPSTERLRKMRENGIQQGDKYELARTKT